MPLGSHRCRCTSVFHGAHMAIGGRVCGRSEGCHLFSKPRHGVGGVINHKGTLAVAVSFLVMKES